MALDVDLWCSIMNGDKNELNEESKRIIIKGLSKLDADKVGHRETKKKMLYKLPFLYGGDNYEAS